MEKGIFTIGHSNHSIEHFVELLKKHHIQVVFDVRSSPYSQYTSQFNRESLEKQLLQEEIKYIFLGEELGVRSKDPDCYIDGKVSYSRLAAKSSFQTGISHLLKNAEMYPIAIMCAEKDPIDCHRMILISQIIHRKGIIIKHIHYDGSLESHLAATLRLRQLYHLDAPDLFKSEEDLSDQAFIEQEKRIAYKPDNSDYQNLTH